MLYFPLLVGKARTSLFFGSFGTAWAANRAQAKLCSPKVLLVDIYEGVAYSSHRSIL